VLVWDTKLIQTWGPADLKTTAIVGDRPTDDKRPPDFGFTLIDGVEVAGEAGEGRGQTVRWRTALIYTAD